MALLTITTLTSECSTRTSWVRVPRRASYRTVWRLGIGGRPQVPGRCTGCARCFGCAHGSAATTAPRPVVTGRRSVRQTDSQGRTMKLTQGLIRVSRFLLKAVVYVAFRLRPVGTSRLLGVQMGEGVRIYGGDPSMWSTEPFLITLGDNVHITAGCAFVTHDGGTLILRREVPDLELTAPISVGNDVYIGMRSLILPGVTIGS